MNYFSASHSSDKAAEQEQIEQVGIAPQLKFREKVKRHCARWWWLHALVFCAGTLIVTLCLIYVGFPRIAQSGVDASTMEFTSLQFLDPAPDAITITQSAILHNGDIFTPTLDAFNASLYLVTNGTFGPAPIATLTIPSVHVLHPTSSVNITQQRVKISDLDELTDYAIQVLARENVTTALTGEARLHEGRLPIINIHYNSSTTYKTLNGLKGFNIMGVKLNLTALAGEPNLYGSLIIPNPSCLTVALGNVTLSLSTETSGVVGNATLSNLTISPGSNIFPMVSILNETKALASVDKNGLMNVLITGTSVVYNNQHITYYERALANNILSLQLNVTQILADSA